MILLNFNQSKNGIQVIEIQGNAKYYNLNLIHNILTIADKIK